jgi:phosphoglycolate phosphatase
MMNLIMFDMDGTLFRTETSFFPAVQEFAGRHAFPVPDEEFLRSFIGQSGSEWRAWLEQLQLGISTQDLVSEFDLLEQGYVKTQGELYPGAAEVLRTLAQDGWKLGVCSNAPAWYPEAILTRAGVRDLFTLIRVPGRPDQSKAMMLCDIWNEFHPERCAMAGDRADDMQAAYAGGYFAIGAAYGWGPEELELADVRVHDISEIPVALAVHWLPGGEPEIAKAPVSVAPAASPVPQAPAVTPRVQETVPDEPVVAAILPEEESSRTVAATEPMVETTAATRAAEPMPLEEIVASSIETPAVATRAEPATPVQAPNHVVAPLPPVQPAQSQVQPSPEPTATAPVIVVPVEPAVTPSPHAAPLHPTPQVVTPPPVEPTVAPRRSWNPFRKHEDKPR